MLEKPEVTKISKKKVLPPKRNSIKVEKIPIKRARKQKFSYKKEQFKNILKEFFSQIKFAISEECPPNHFKISNRVYNSEGLIDDPDSDSNCSSRDLSKMSYNEVHFWHEQKYTNSDIKQYVEYVDEGADWLEVNFGHEEELKGLKLALDVVVFFEIDIDSGLVTKCQENPNIDPERTEATFNQIQNYGKVNGPKKLNYLISLKSKLLRLIKNLCKTTEDQKTCQCVDSLERHQYPFDYSKIKYEDVDW